MFDPKDGRISIDLRTLVQRIISRSVVSSVPHIQKAFLDKTDPKKWVLRVEGVNITVSPFLPDAYIHRLVAY